MSAICLIDTSIFVEILNVPMMANRNAQIMIELKDKINNEELLFLPMATIFETGNHIAQNGDGSQRRDCAKVFVDQVRLALAGDSPFRPIRFIEAEQMQLWLDEFPDSAMKGTGLGDLSIAHNFQEMCQKIQGRRVYIWSLDGHLSSFNQAARIE
jgi:hypothetical protein